MQWPAASITSSRGSSPSLVKHHHVHVKHINLEIPCDVRPFLSGWIQPQNIVRSIVVISISSKHRKLNGRSINKLLHIEHCIYLSSKLRITRICENLQTMCSRIAQLLKKANPAHSRPQVLKGLASLWNCYRPLFGLDCTL